jgi:hypothetical protein
MKVDWSGLLPQEVFDSLVSAPKQVAGPWQPACIDGEFMRWPPCRRTPDGVTVVWEFDGQVTIHALAFAHQVVAPKPVECESRQKADEVLRKAGWLLV